jgi:anti-sigma-K factor RskA
VNDIHDLLGAYCTDALDADEAAAFEQHLATCDQCRAEAAEFREVLAALSEAHPVRPPRDLEDAVVARAQAGRSGQGTDVSGSAHPQAGGPLADTGPGAGSAPDADRGSPLVPGRARAARWMAAAAAAAVLFAGGVALGRSQAPVESAAGAGDMAAVVAVASAQDAHVLPVDIMGTTSRVVMSQEMDKAVFLASDLPMPAKGMCYQVWRVSPDGTMESAGVAVPAPDGHIAVLLDGGAQDVSKFMITMEPPGGSEHPSGEMLAEIDT